MSPKKSQPARTTPIFCSSSPPAGTPQNGNNNEKYDGGVARNASKLFQQVQKVFGTFPHVTTEVKIWGRWPGTLVQFVPASIGASIRKFLAFSHVTTEPCCIHHERFDRFFQFCTTRSTAQEASSSDGARNKDQNQACCASRVTVELSTTRKYQPSTRTPKTHTTQQHHTQSSHKAQTT